jgi:hypothetical protein
MHFIHSIARNPVRLKKARWAAQTMTGADGIRVFGLPGDRVVQILRKYNRVK